LSCKRVRYIRGSRDIRRDGLIRTRKPLSSLRGTEGSNPSLSATYQVFAGLSCGSPFSTYNSAYKWLAIAMAARDHAWPPITGCPGLSTYR
jgi:hypothetical protein